MIGYFVPQLSQRTETFVACGDLCGPPFRPMYMDIVKPIIITSYLSNMIVMICIRNTTDLAAKFWSTTVLFC